MPEYVQSASTQTRQTAPEARDATSSQLTASSSGRTFEHPSQTLVEVEAQTVVQKLLKRNPQGLEGKPANFKQYPPVFKGGLQLPGGPNWSAFRRHISYKETSGLPHVNAILMVEGDNDYEAVSKAVNVPAYVFQGTRLQTEHAQVEVSALKALGRPIIVLTDPDPPGRQFRMQIDDMIGPTYHAFLPEALAVTTTGTMTKDAGNRGVEHAQPEAITHALSVALLSYGPGREEFSREELAQMHLLNDAGSRVANVELRRRLLCAVLGLGDCRSAALLAALNRFISREQLMDHLADVDRRLAAMGATLGGATMLKSQHTDARLLEALA